MYPEALIKPIDRAAFEPYFDKMLPGLQAALQVGDGR